MSPRIKKLLGTIIILIWVPIYSLIAMGIALHLLPHASWYAAFLFYAIAGTLWIIPIGLMLPWMYREPNSKDNRAT
jgi:membrane protein implicated in regulation of membrane protease activity